MQSNLTKQNSCSNFKDLNFQPNSFVKGYAQIKQGSFKIRMTPQTRENIIKHNTKYNKQGIQNKITQLKRIPIKADQYAFLRGQGKSNLQSLILSKIISDEKFDEFLEQITNEKDFETKKQQLIDNHICSFQDLMNIKQELAEDLCIESEQFKQIRMEYQRQNNGEQFPIFSVNQFKIQNDQPTLNILVLGQTGAGKSSFINMIGNCCLLENENEPFRVQVIMEENEKKCTESSTDQIKTYVLNNRKSHLQMVLIDTPGFCDTKGIKMDQQISQELQQLLTKKLNQINLICLVKKESDNRLDDQTKYVLANIFELLGKDIQENLQIILSYSQFCKNPKVIQIFKDQKEFCDIYNNILEPRYMQFDFGDEVVYGKEFVQKLCKNFYNFEKLQTKMKCLKPQCLIQTQIVIIARQKIIEQIDQLKNNLMENLNQLANIQKIFNLLGNHEQKVIQQIYIEKIPIPDNQYVTNCLVCNETCHFPCNIQRDDRKYFCSIIQKGKCMFCQLQCQWFFHKNNNYQIRMKSKTETIECRQIEKETLLKQYKQKVIQFFLQQQQIIGLLNQIDENALLPNSYGFTEGYLNLLIQNEIRSKQLGFEERIFQIKNILKTYELLQGEELKQQSLYIQLSPLMMITDISDLKNLLLGSGQQGIESISNI